MSDQVVLLHGFTQTGQMWRRVCADLWAAARYVAERFESGTLVGYSLGARLALHVALLYPEKVNTLVLFGPRLGFADTQEAAFRRAADEEMAVRIERDGVEAFLDEWLALPFNARVSQDRLGRGDRLRNRAGGLAASLRNCGAGTQDDLRRRLDELNIGTSLAVTVVVGEDDQPGVIDDSKVFEAAGATRIVVEGAGHSVPMECPEAALHAIRTALSIKIRKRPA